MVPNYIPVAPNAKFTLQDLKPNLIVGKSVCDQRSAVFMCELLNDASKRLPDVSPTPNKYLAC